jgi:predicted ATPase/class 3 adenylate cyclase
VESTGEFLTFFFSDIEGSTHRWATSADEMALALAAHDDVLRGAVAVGGGRVLKHTGDGCVAVFPSPTGAVAAAVAAQRRFSVGDIGGDRIEALKIRVGLHTGSATARDDDYFGPTLNRAGRISTTGHGGQTVISEVTAALVRDLLPNDVTLVDLGRYQLRDLPAPEQLYQLAIDGLETSFPPLRTATIERPKLPVPRGRLIGRDEAVASLAATMSSGERLVTLTGVGGVGKTRLALAAAAASGSAFVDGASFVELASVADPDLLPRAIADALGMSAGGGLDGRDGIGLYLAPRNALLILDNCEHVLDACADLVDLILETAPRVVVLATSREPLAVEGERVWPVRSLAGPERAGELSPSEVLFWERARAGGELADTPEHRAAVAEICRRLDGIPLAIELAASRVRHFPPQQLLALLDDRFRLLAGGKRRSQQRHQTLQATMDWSYALLTLTEQQLLRTLSAFSGGFVLDAAIAVGANGDTDTVNTLTQLVDKSLVELDESESEARYRLLETVRLYARQKLVDEHEAASVFDRHADWILAWTEARFDARQLLVARVLRREADNVRAALDWADESGRHDVVVRLALAFSPVWVWDMRAEEGFKWLLGDAIREADETLPLESRLLWRGAAALLYNATTSADGLALADEAIALDPGASPSAFQARFAKAQVQSFFDVDSATADWGEPPDDPTMEATWAYEHGVIRLMAGDYETARADFDKAVASADVDPWIEVWVFLSQAVLDVMTNRFDDAVAEAERGLERVDPEGFWIQDLAAQSILGMSRAKAGDIEGARSSVGSAIELSQRSYPHVAKSGGLAIISAGTLLEASGDLNGALDLYEDVSVLLLHVRMEIMFHYVERTSSRLRHELGSGRRVRARRTEAELIEGARAIAQESVPARQA